VRFGGTNSCPQATEKLIGALWKLPVERTAQGPVALLPLRGLTLPREKPLPEAKKQTRWEKFAEEKGIEKKKRGRMVWDDMEQKWAPRTGYKRAYGEDETPILEVKTGEDPNADPWDRQKEEKKARVAKNDHQRAKNDERAGRRTAAITAGLPVDMPTGPKAKKGEVREATKQKGKAGGAAALALAQHSTASMGKFDVRRFGEPKQIKVAGTRKASGLANDTTAGGLATEKARNAKLLGRVLSANDRGLKPKFKGDKGERIEARKRSREFHPLDDAPYANMGGGDAGEFKKKKGRAAAGKMTKVTKKRIK